MAFIRDIWEKLEKKGNKKNTIQSAILYSFVSKIISMNKKLYLWGTPELNMKVYKKYYIESNVKLSTSERKKLDESNSQYYKPASIKKNLFI